MRKFIIILFCLALLYGGLANAEPLIAEYYETVYWGETKSRERNGLEYTGRAWKTHRIFPEKDYTFVLEEVDNGDDMTVSLVWTSRDHDTGSIGYALGVCFASPVNTHAICGSLIFSTEENLKKFLNEFKGDGSNVWELIDYAQRAEPSSRYLAELASQIAESAAREIGK